MSDINKEALEKLAKLSKLKIDESREEKFLLDLEKILDHFKELQELPPRKPEGLKTKKVLLRNDEESAQSNFKNQDKLIQAFPEEENRYNHVPPIIDHNKQ